MPSFAKSLLGMFSHFFAPSWEQCCSICWLWRACLLLTYYVSAKRHRKKSIAKAAILGVCGILQSITQLCRQLLVKSKVIAVTQMERLIVTVLYICSITLLDSSKLVLSSHHNSHHGSEDKAECEDSRADERLFYLL